MPKRSEPDQQFFKIKKAVVAAIRLKHALAADDEINEVVWDLKERYYDAISTGQVFELNTADYLEERDAVQG